MDKKINQRLNIREIYFVLIITFILFVSIAIFRNGKVLGNWIVLADETEQLEQPESSEQEQPEVKLKYKVEDDGLILKKTDDNGKEVEATEREQSQTKKLLEEQDIKVATDDGSIQFEHNGVKANTNFPLSIDTSTKQLVVTTPAGQKAVTILPDEAINNMLRVGIATYSATSSPSGAVSPTLETVNGQLVYRIDGLKHVKLLGFIPVGLPTTALVSSTTGNIVSVQQSLLTKLLALISSNISQ